MSKYDERDHDNHIIEMIHKADLRGLERVIANGEWEVDRLLRKVERVGAVKRLSAMCWAADMYGSPEVIRFFAEKGCSTREKNGSAPIELAIRATCAGNVEALLEVDPDLANVPVHELDGAPPIFKIIERGGPTQITMAKMVLRFMDNPGATDKRGQNGLHIAGHKSRDDLAALLIKAGCPVNHRDQNGLRPVDCAAMLCGASKRKVTILGELLKAKATVDQEFLYSIALAGCPDRDVYEAALQQGLSLNEFDEVDGITPLHADAEHSSGIENTRMLLEMGADPTLRSPKTNETPIDVARKNGHHDKLDLMNAWAGESLMMAHEPELLSNNTPTPSP